MTTPFVKSRLNRHALNIGDDVKSDTKYTDYETISSVSKDSHVELTFIIPLSNCPIESITQTILVSTFFSDECKKKITFLTINESYDKVLTTTTKDNVETKVISTVKKMYKEDSTYCIGQCINYNNSTITINELASKHLAIIHVKNNIFGVLPLQCSTIMPNINMEIDYNCDLHYTILENKMHITKVVMYCTQITQKKIDIL